METEKKQSFKEQFLNMINEKYGVAAAAAAEGVVKGHDKQVKVAMEDGGVPAQEMFKQLGIDLGTIEVKGKEGGNGKETLQKLLPQQSTPTIKQIPASSPFGFGGMTQEGDQFIQQKPGILAGLLSTIVSGSPNTSANMDLKRLLKTSEIVQNQARSQYFKSGGVNQQVPGLDTLTADQQIQAFDLAKRISGVRGAKNVLPSIVQGLNQGKTIDQIEDSLRYSQQSSQLSNEVRDAAQSALVKASPSQTNKELDALDDYLQKGDDEGAKSYLKRISLQQATADQQNYVMGKERTVDFLNEIQGDLKTLEKNGFPTGFFSGNMENVLARVGQVKNPEMRKVATKIATAMIQYRRSVTGVQFGQAESEEYKKMFPGINRVGAFNTATINALKDSFTGDVEKFYQQSMGPKNYDKIFGSKKVDDPEYNKLMSIVGGK